MDEQIFITDGPEVECEATIKPCECGLTRCSVCGQGSRYKEVDQRCVQCGRKTYTIPNVTDDPFCNSPACPNYGLLQAWLD